MADRQIDIQREQYLDNWSELMVKYWIERMNAEMVGVSEKPDGSPRYSSGALRRSFTVSLMKQAGGNTAKISHMFEHYGMYLDGGVFPGTKGSGGQNRISNTNRNPKPWRAKKYWYSQRRLQEKMVELTGQDYLRSVSYILRSTEK
jgi:hypothetical protein